MAGIGKSSSSEGDKKTSSVKDQKQELEKLKQEIAQKRGGKKLSEMDKNDLASLRTLYLRTAGLARTLSEVTTDVDEAASFKATFEKCNELARKCGSSVNSRVPTTTFDDVKGMDNVKKLVKSFMFMSQHPEILKYYKMEGGLGMLMYGAPGTGKTMFAEAIANAMNLPLFIITPADIFKSYVGESEQAVKQLFEEIDACPDGAILFVDECESIFSARTKDTKDYKAAVTTELLQRINGFGVNGSKRIMIAATNRPEIIDPAYLRYKRFSHIVHVTPPDDEAIRSIVESKLKGIQLEGITIDDVMEMTRREKIVNDPELGTYSVKEGYYSAADICGIMEEACRMALERIQEAGITTPIPLTRDMFEAAFEKTPPSISAKVLEEYNNFLKTRS